jgi:signal peptidase I
MTSDRRPWPAALLGLVVPGLGHLYAGNLRRAIRWWAAFVALVALLMLLMPYFPVPIVAAAALVFALTTAARIAAASSAVRLTRAAPRPYQLQPFNRWYVYLLVWAATAAIAELVIQRPNPYAAFRITAGSMAPTLLVGDFIYCSKSPELPPTDGSLISFVSVELPGVRVLKRIVGIPGDTLAMLGGALRRNGPSLLRQPGLPDGDHPPSGNTGIWESGHIPVFR